METFHRGTNARDRVGVVPAAFRVEGQEVWKGPFGHAVFRQPGVKTVAVT